MAIVAGNVIDAARDRHTAFDRKVHPNKMLLRHLSQYVKRLHGKIVAIDEDAVRVEIAPVALPLADFAAGVVLPANVRYVAGASVTYPPPSTTAPVALDLIQSDERNARNTPANAAWVVNGVLYLSGNANRWSAFNALAISVVFVPADLTDLTETLAVPDAAEEACTEALALFMARRESQESDGEAKIAIQPFAASASDAERSFLDDVKNNVAGRTFYTQDVYP